MPRRPPAVPHPFVLDENIDGLDMLLRAKADLAMDVVNLKISKFGGLTKTRQARDLCVELGIAMTLEEPGAATSPPRPSPTWPTARRRSSCFTTTDFNSYVTVSTAEGRRSGGTDAWRPPPPPASGSIRACPSWGSRCSK